nr:MAG TPA_asm: hypothetical protein [Caudoviricetes sp.]DAV95341.1 MAG TPA: hypothetical protein [Caudoviricetes sp.]
MMHVSHLFILDIIFNKSLDILFNILYNFIQIINILIIKRRRNYEQGKN